MPVDGQKLSQTNQVTTVDILDFLPLFQPNLSNTRIRFVDLIIQIKQLIDAYTKAETDLLLDAKANDSDVVHKTGNETIFDEKSFDSFPLLPTSDPTQDYQAVHKKYVHFLYDFLANQFNQLNAAVNQRWVIPTNIDCALNPAYPASIAGETYRVTNPGKVGGVTDGVKVQEGDIILCLVTNPGGNQPTVGNQFTIINRNIDEATPTESGTIKISTHVSVVAGLATDEAVTPETLFFAIDNLLVRKTALKTHRFYFGVNTAPAGYIQVPASTILTHASLVGVTIYGMCFMDNSPFDYILDTPFNTATGTMNLTSFGNIYEGSKLVFTSFK
ncbi:MAG: hypothetical protein WC756_17655 [Taibaiella sp.]|jgi:hypothetical protein